MAGRELRAKVTRFITAPPELVWALLSDSNRWDRVVGMSPSSYGYESLEIEGRRRRVRVGSSRYRGIFPLRWLEVGEWVEGRSMWGERRFLHGLLERAGIRFAIEAADGGSQVEACAYAVG